MNKEVVDIDTSEENTDEGNPYIYIYYLNIYICVIKIMAYCTTLDDFLGVNTKQD